MSCDERVAWQKLVEISNDIYALKGDIDGIKRSIGLTDDYSEKQMDDINKIKEQIDAILNNEKYVVWLTAEVEKHKDHIMKLEDYMEMEGRVTGSDILLRLTAIETQLDTVRALGSRAYHPKVPHKCPVCLGEGKTVSLTNMKLYDCKPCDGVGVILA